uniref:Secreted protein n=1 Tax=Strongyloides papillosus TaxID=174720 RepID=A0A0N5C2S9_STREA
VALHLLQLQCLPQCLLQVVEEEAVVDIVPDHQEAVVADVVVQCHNQGQHQCLCLLQLQHQCQHLKVPVDILKAAEAVVLLEVIQVEAVAVAQLEVIQEVAVVAVALLEVIQEEVDSVENISDSPEI